MSNATNLSKRMRYLCKAEASIAVVLPTVFVFYWVNNGVEPAWGVRVPSLALVSYILVQGALYWGLKFRQYAHQIALPSWLPAVFRFFRWSNVIGSGAVALALALAANRGVASADLAWAGGLWLFAVLEHINYYHFQLMYDTRSAWHRLRMTGRLRTPMLASDLRPR